MLGVEDLDKSIHAEIEGEGEKEGERDKREELCRFDWCRANSPSRNHNKSMKEGEKEDEIK